MLPEVLSLYVWSGRIKLTSNLQCIILHNEEYALVFSVFYRLCYGFIHTNWSSVSAAALSPSIRTTLYFTVFEQGEYKCVFNFSE